MTTPLLDANVLIALTHPEHVHHGPVRAWDLRHDRLAVCPIVEGALLRYLLRTGTGVATAVSAIAQLHANPRYEFWPDSLSYADADLGGVVGHRQVTDAYLVSLARHHGARLATLDRPLATAYPASVELISA